MEDQVGNAMSGLMWCVQVAMWQVTVLMVLGADLSTGCVCKWTAGERGGVSQGLLEAQREL